MDFWQLTHTLATILRIRNFHNEQPCEGLKHFDYILQNICVFLPFILLIFVIGILTLKLSFDILMAVTISFSSPFLAASISLKVIG